MTVLSPEVISSTNPFSSPSFFDRILNSGLTLAVRSLVNITVAGTVTAKIKSIFGEMNSIPKKEPPTVMILVHICKRSLEREAFTVSIS